MPDVVEVGGARRRTSPGAGAHGLAKGELSADFVWKLSTPASPATVAMTTTGARLILPVSCTGLIRARGPRPMA